MLIHVLLAAKDAAERDRLRGLLRQRDVALATARDTKALHSRLAGGDFDLVVVSRDLLPDPPRKLIDFIRKLPEHPEIVVVANGEDAEDRAALLALGCLAVLNRNLTEKRFTAAFRSIIVRQRKQAITSLRVERAEEQYSLNDFVSDSPVMQLFLRLARKVVHSDSSVLVLGETGVGKERLARAIHAEGPRASGPFMAVNCGALPESLLESELFGHEEGAFTGASRARRGYFELAHGGTLFLDEIGEIPAHTQVRLLRVLDEGRIYRVGGEKPITVDVRAMAATNKNIEAEMEAGRFRSDLFFRLAVVTLTVPPLRDRREDIAHLVQSYLEHFRVQTGKPVTSVSGEAMSLLTRYDWPGNVRELINTIERAVLFCTSDEIGAQDLSTRVLEAVRRTDRATGNLIDAGHSINLPEALLVKSISEARRSVVAAFETSYLSELLRSTGGQIRETARLARLNERSLYDLMKKHGLRKEDFKIRDSRSRRT